MIRPYIKKDGTKVWRSRIGHGGKMTTWATKREAQEYEDEQRRNERRADAGMETVQGPITFGELAKLWKLNSDPSDWRLRMLKYSEDKWGDVKVRSMKSEGIGAWLHSLPYSGKTQKHILETLRQVLNAGVEWGYLRQSPARPGAFKPPSEKRQREIRPFASWDEVEKVAALLGQNHAALVRFVCATGLRSPSEVQAIRWADIDKAGRTLTVHGTKTANAARTIPLQNRALAAIEGLPRRIDGRVFAPFDWRGFARNHWRPALAKAGLADRTPYEMRHTFATLALEAGAAIEDVSKVLGHANIDITGRYYAKWTRPRLDRMRELLDASINSASSSSTGSTRHT